MGKTEKSVSNGALAINHATQQLNVKNSKKILIFAQILYRFISSIDFIQQSIANSCCRLGIIHVIPSPVVMHT